MQTYYANQASLPHFSGHYRQRGSGFGALAAGIGRFALPLAKKFILPAAKKIGKELLVQGAPEILEVITKKKTPKQAVKNTLKKTVKKQIGGRSVTRKTGRRATRRRSVRIINRRTPVKRSRSDFFSKLKHDR